MNINLAIKILAILFYGFSLSACATKVTDIDLTIDNSGDNCIVRLKDESFPLKLNTPCQLLKKSDHSIQYQKYNDLGQVFIVVGSPASPDFLKRWGDDINPSCSDTAQHIVVGDEVKIGTSIIKGGLFCPDRGLDEIFFRDVYDRLD